ncbi:3,4-dihydroxy-2-butanone-4-phosphate synthase [Caulobacter sp. S45]|uniref:3,4-dihydroxy-2-butanone-4-phosphate synthase n=1 Tax=Caulobacter sp. S45 TaxID=1641861 RepID=UPI00131D6B6A|nr:3,4-dihydroxy-2-butanone-4-phosphate synthase [Caulobacter sp. S45]
MSALSEALTRLSQGGMIILVDDEDRENEGDLVIAAQFADAAAINFLAAEARGLICLALTGERVDRLGLAPMVQVNRTSRQTAFTVSIEARTGVTTGISAADRARTVAAAAAPGATAADIVSPGHIFPLRAVDNGVLARAGHTEGSVDLMRMAGLEPAAVICEVMNADGTMARRPDLEVFAQRHGLPILTIREVIAYRLAHEQWMEEAAVARLPSAYAGGADLEAHAFVSRLDGGEHLALVKRPFLGAPLVRVHSECLTGDALGSLRCDCGEQLRRSVAEISASATGGALIYLRGQEGRGVGLANKIRAYALQDQGMDTVDANTALGLPVDGRDYAVAAQILKALGLERIVLLTNNPHKADALAAYGIEVEARAPVQVTPNPHNAAYLATKRLRMGHDLAETAEPPATKVKETCQ